MSDINAMHRYRDAIVYQHGAATFERTMFGAYVLFPYSNETAYKHHKFYESIGKVNIGGLPFLPSALELVSSMLDELISDSPDSAFERATLPVGIDEKLAKVDWTRRDVLVGSLSSTQQLAICKAYNDSLIIFEGGTICVYQDKKCRLKYSASEFGRRPNAVFRSIQAGIQSLQSATMEG